ncbi:MAG: AI-2E family transporter [Candidatus Peribacteria bacterium]|nr:AI-2E family transporter [Candidatus Peribacteria bacterium]
MLLYVAFILFEYRFFRRKIYIIVHNMRNKKIIINAYDKIKLEVKSYFFVKFWISLVSALVSYLIMLFFGLKFSTFWAVLIFILNFIPNIGSLIAISMPSILSFVQP